MISAAEMKKQTYWYKRPKGVENAKWEFSHTEDGWSTYALPTPTSYGDDLGQQSFDWKAQQGWKEGTVDAPLLWEEAKHRFPFGLSRFGYSTVIPKPPKIEKKKRLNHQEDLKDVKRYYVEKDGQNKDMDLGNDKKDEMNEFTKWYDELFGGGWDHKTLQEDSVNFPGVYPGTAFASLKRIAVSDLKLQLLKALSRAQDLGMIKDYKNALIDVGGRRYTYDTLPEALVQQAIQYLTNKMGKQEAPQTQEQQQGTQNIQQFTDYLKQMPGMGGEMPIQQTAARSFPLAPTMPGEDTTSMPEQTDNKPVVEDMPVYQKQVKPTKQFDGSYPWIETGNPNWDYMDSAMYDTFYFFGA